MNNEIRDAIDYLRSELQRFYPMWMEEGIAKGQKDFISALNRIDKNLTKPMVETATNLKTLNNTMNSLANMMGRAAVANTKALKDEHTYKKMMLEQLKKETLQRKENAQQIDKAIKSLRSMNSEVEDLTDMYDDLQKTIKMNNQTLEVLDKELTKLEDTVSDNVQTNKKATKATDDLAQQFGKTDKETKKFFKGLANLHFGIEQFMNQAIGTLKNTRDTGQTISGAGHTIGVALENIGRRFDESSGILGSSFSLLSGTVRMTMAMYGGVISELEDQMRVYRELNKAGILLSARFDESAQMAAKYSLDQDQLNKALIANSSLFSKSSTDTINNFMKLSHMATRANTIYTRLGMSQEETMDYIAKYMETMKITGQYERTMLQNQLSTVIDDTFKGMSDFARFFGKEITDVLKETNDFMRQGSTQAQMALFKLFAPANQKAEVGAKTEAFENMVRVLPQDAQEALRAVFMQQMSARTGAPIPAELQAKGLVSKEISPEIYAAISQLVNTDGSPDMDKVRQMLIGASEAYGNRMATNPYPTMSAIHSPDQAVGQQALGFAQVTGALSGQGLDEFLETRQRSTDATTNDSVSAAVDASKRAMLRVGEIRLSLVDTLNTWTSNVLGIGKTSFMNASFITLKESIDTLNTFLDTTMKQLTEVLDTDSMGKLGESIDELIVAVTGLTTAFAIYSGVSIGQKLGKLLTAGGSAVGAAGAGSAAAGGASWLSRAAGFVGRFAGRTTLAGAIIAPTQMGDGTLPVESMGTRHVDAEKRFNLTSSIKSALLDEIMAARTGSPTDMGYVNQLLSELQMIVGPDEYPTLKEKIKNQLISDHGINMSEIPQFARGGVITGPTFGLLAEAGRPEMVMPLDPSMSDLAKHIAEKHVQIVGPYLRQLNNEFIYRQFRENRDVIDEIFTVALDKFLFSKMEVQRVFSALNDPNRTMDAGLESTMNMMRAFNIDVMGGSARFGGIAERYNLDTQTGQGPYQGGAATGRAEQAIRFFMSKGWSREQAAGIVGNLQAESGMNLNEQAIGDGGKAFGIAQWHPDRQANFRKVFGKDIRNSTFDEQLAFIQWEFENTEARAAQKLKEATSATSAAVIVDQFYERSSGAHRGRRIENSMNLMRSSSAINGIPMTNGNNVIMTNSGAIRNKPIDPILQQKLSEAVMNVFGPGYIAEVYSGGNDPNNPHGTNRHNDGQAADIRIRAPDGSYLTGNQNAPLAQYWLAKGHGSAGAGMGAGGTGLHLDLMTQNRLSPGQGLSWTYDNATKGQISALNAGRSGILPDLYAPNGFDSTTMSTSQSGSSSGAGATLAVAVKMANVIADRVVDAINTTATKTNQTLRGQAVAIAKSQGKIIGPQ